MTKSDPESVQKPDEKTGLPGGKRTKHRSPNYPAVSLPAAINGVQALYDEEGPAGAPLTEAVKHFGFSSPHGSAMVVVSALKKYGLIEDKGSRLAPTLLAKSIIEFPENDERRIQAVRTAALKPAIIRELVEEFQGHGRLPSDGSLRAELITKKNFNPKTVGDFIRDFRETLLYAGLADDAGLFSREAVADQDGGDAKEEIPSIQAGDFVQWTSQGVDQFPEPRRVVGISEDGRFAFFEESRTGVPMNRLKREKPKTDAQPPTIDPQQPPANPFYKSPSPRIQGWPENPSGGATRELPITLPSLEIAVLRLPVPMTEEDYDTLLQALEGMKKALTRDLRASDAGRATDSATVTKQP
jgi:hypothetical protein